ncbi:MAG: TIGR02206 family membrane protein [Anaerolineales bacterium]|nr:TIGR02206 family membrane protein [Anaerolineales bacterium]
MDTYFTSNYTGEPFQFFGTAHIITLLIGLALFAGVFYLPKITTPTSRKWIRYTLAIILILNELAYHTWHIVYGRWTLQTMLPFHLCSVMVWLGAYMLFTNNGKIADFMYFLGLAGATQALLTPDVGIYGFPHFRYFQTYIAHTLIIVSALYMMVVEGFRPTWASAKRVFIWTNLYAAFVFVLNLLIGSNYLFIAHKPETPSLIDMLGPWPWYIIPLELIAISMILLLYSPYAIKDWKERVRSQTA